ncbi:hypothetical protein RhiXN_04644 [Rhizoctonia solani]|uniref:Uncharacterized protein n=1 Tax=Rhizoctonia solani TaxID=456999 RepID=A0A8H8NQR0_9AGAM|nr:uncharacterized protein RhiXN_04644 [Rhizoctonia solani]QRW16643.1 hypothetical protein RhiXN_04644 [Rhizoctonia solani]
MKHSSNLELFLAVWKLRKLLKSGTINEEKFLQDCCMLLGGLEDRTNWATRNLTCNHELMDAILDLLAHVHIAATFPAGSWMRLTTGCLYMVAAGLVHEMLAQVDLLTEGMSDVPKDDLTLLPRSCQMSKLKVILPSCLGSKIVEEELKLMQTVITHMINMITTKDELTLSTKGTSETIENITDHPAGVIAQFLLKKHGDEPNARGYEHKKQQRLRPKKTPGVVAVRQDTFAANLQESDVDDMEDTSYHQESNHGRATMPSLEDHSGDQGQVTGCHGGHDQIEDVEVDHDIEGVHTHQDASEDGGDNEADARLQQGGDWELDKSILKVIASAESMTKEESRGLAELLDQITASHRDGDMQYLVDALLAKGKHVSTKLKKVHEHQNNLVSEDEDRGDGQGSAAEEEEWEEGHTEEA